MSQLVHVFACLVALACLGHALAEDDKSEETDGHVRDMIHSVSSAARRAIDGDVNDVRYAKRDRQVLGFGGRCGGYNEWCSFWGTHCCDQMNCKYKKWTHRFSDTGGRCM